MSGTTKMPRSLRTSSAPGVVGPFAASTMMRAFTSSAFDWLSTPSRAAGMNTSQSTARSSSLANASPPRQPGHRARLGVELREVRVGEPVAVENAAVDVGHGNHLAAEVGEQLHRGSPDLAVS